MNINLNDIEKPCEFTWNTLCINCYLYIDDLRPLVHGPPLEVIELHLAAHEELHEVAGRAAQPAPHELRPRELQHDLGVQELLQEVPQQDAERPDDEEDEGVDLLELPCEGHHLLELSNDLQEQEDSRPHEDLLHDLRVEPLLQVLLELPDLDL